MKIWENKINCKDCGIKLTEGNFQSREGTGSRYFKIFEIFKWESGLCMKCGNENKNAPGGKDE